MTAAAILIDISLTSITVHARSAHSHQGKGEERTVRQEALGLIGQGGRHGGQSIDTRYDHLVG